MHMRTGQPVSIHAHTHTHQTKDCCQWDGFLAFFGGLMKAHQTRLQTKYHFRIIKVETYEPWFSKHRQSCNNSKSYRSIYHINFIYRSFRNRQEGLAGLYLNRSNVSAMYSLLSEKWNNMKHPEFTARFVPFFDLWMLLPTPRKKQKRTCIYYIRRTKLHKTNHIYHKTANKKYRHLSTGKLAKILDSRGKG